MTPQRINRLQIKSGTGRSPDSSAVPSFHRGFPADPVPVLSHNTTWLLPTSLCMCFPLPSLHSDISVAVIHLSQGKLQICLHRHRIIYFWSKHYLLICTFNYSDTQQDILNFRICQFSSLTVWVVFSLLPYFNFKFSTCLQNPPTHILLLRTQSMILRKYMSGHMNWLYSS